MVITGTYNLKMNPVWRAIQTESVYLECDTSESSVVINLFPISELGGFWNVKIHITDKAQNCSNNNIIINTGFKGDPPVFDIVDESGNNQIVLNIDGESTIMQPMSGNQWIAVESVTIPSAVQSVTGLDTDNSDPLNPIVKISVDGNTVTGLGTPLSPIESNVVIGTTKTISGTTGSVFFDNGSTVQESTNFVYDDDEIVLSLGGSTSSAKGMVNLKSKNSEATSYSIAIRKYDDSGYLFQVQNDGKLRINDNYTLPNSDGTTGQVLVTNGAGTVTFQSKQDPITLTTTGNSGASTIIGATLNIPEYTLAGLGGVPTLTTININGVSQDLSASRLFSVSDANLSMSDITTNDVSITKHGFTPKLPNDSTKFLDGVGNWSVPASYGVWGISNSTGKYTYYSTLTLAIASASAGQTIELFADVIENGAVSITLKNGVNIQGNGHTYTLNSNDSTLAFVTPISVETSLSFTNITIVRSVGSGACFSLGTNGSSIINFSGTKLINTGTGIAFTSGSSTSAEISYLYASATSSAAIQTNGTGQILKFCEGKSTSGIGIHSVNGGVYYNCIGTSSSNAGIYIQTPNGVAYNSVGSSSSNIGLYNFGYCYNCVGRSTTGNGLTSALFITGCLGISVSGAGLSLSTGKSFNCDGVSSSSYGIRMADFVEIYNCTSYSASSFSIWNTNGLNNKFYNCNINTDYNNAAGYGVRGNGGNFPLTFVNCTFKLANNTAPYLYNDNIAKALELVNNVYQGGAVYNANLTQAVVATKDNQGNIFM